MEVIDKRERGYVNFLDLKPNETFTFDEEGNIAIKLDRPTKITLCSYDLGSMCTNEFWVDAFIIAGPKAGTFVGIDTKAATTIKRIMCKLILTD